MIETFRRCEKKFLMNEMQYKEFMKRINNDDSIHTNSNMTITSGTFNIKSNDGRT